MSSFMEKLLDDVEVERRTLGQIGEFIRGNGMQKKDFVDTGFPAIHYGQIYTKYGLSATKTFVSVSDELARKLRIANTNDLLLATTSENDEDVVKPLAWLGKQAAISGDMMLFRHAQNVKYLAYYFQTESFQEQKRKYITGAKVRRVSSGDLAKIVVPIPCPDNPKKSLEIQAEIVRILDTFTSLTTELTTELNARKKQYNYYRDKLLSFEEGEAEWKTLGECFPQIRNGFVGTVTPFYTDSSIGIRYLQGTNIKNGKINDDKVFFVTKEFHQRQKKTILKADDILVVQSGHVGDSAVVGIEYQDSNCHALIVMSNGGNCNSKFVNYYLQSREGQGKLAHIVTGGTVKHILASKIKKVIVPLPPSAEQARIVAILDKFEALTNSLREGLPREIELRQKQYEYYRDLLLSFPKQESEEAA